MPASSPGSLASRAARQLGLDTARVAGTGPDGATTLADVLRQAGRSPPAAARPAPPRRSAGADAEAGEGACRIEVACDAEGVRDACRSLAALGVDPPDAFDVVVRLCGTALREFPGLSGTTEEEGEGSRAASIDVQVADPLRAMPILGAEETGVRAIRDALREDRSTPRTGAPGAPEAGSGVEPAAAFVIRTPDAPDVRPAAKIGGNDRRGCAVLTIAEQSGSILLGLELEAESEEEGVNFLDRLRTLCLDPRRALL